MLRAISHRHGGRDQPAGTIRLDHAARHLRRKLVTTDQGDEIMVDLPEPVLFADGDRLVLDDGRSVAIMAAEEELYEVLPGTCPLRHLAWHLGNRHLPAQIDEGRILIQRDHVIRAMLEGLGASVRDVVARFQPVHGAYHAHGHDRGHAHHHDHGHAHGHHHDHD
ncbi:urease accessory protein UreE [Bosea sp. (in: a-proteobacteria)]|uniref:urease accessory protein UreE n=1 Tax=Bosea sp. (in: a-proteobacteria) TaxID=1871050 RepID=UPI0033409A2A